MTRRYHDHHLIHHHHHDTSPSPSLPHLSPTQHSIPSVRYSNRDERPAAVTVAVPVTEAATSDESFKYGVIFVQFVQFLLRKPARVRTSLALPAEATLEVPRARNGSPLSPWPVAFTLPCFSVSFFLRNPCFKFCVLSFFLSQTCSTCSCVYLPFFLSQTCSTCSCVSLEIRSCFTVELV